MDKEILSLKSIYRFLTVNDFPIYTTGIFREEYRKGLTLVKFWQDNLLYEFRNHKYGKIIWRNTGGRNRYISEICNRSDRMHFYKDYALELASAVTPNTILRQIQQFMFFLRERLFFCDVFLKKLWALLEQYEADDEYFQKAVAKYLGKNRELESKFNSLGDEGQAFYCSWYLTWMMLYAMAGSGMEEPQFAAIQQEEELGLLSLWKLYLKGRETKNGTVNFITNRNSELCSEPLPQNRFFGREEALFDVQELLRKGGRYLISGVGGIGKTELMRQLLRYCCQEKLVDDICVVQYEDSLADSLIKAFPSVAGSDQESKFREILGRIRSLEGHRVLLLIDNLNHTTENDEGLRQLLTLPAVIFVTSRLPQLEGFEKYLLEAPSQTARMLIFRDNYEQILNSADRKRLGELLEQNGLNHTLTLRLLGRAAKCRNWTVEELEEQLLKEQVQFSWSEEGRMVHLKQIYQRMYSVSGLPRQSAKLLHMFSVISYRSYSVDFITRFLIEDVHIDKETEEILQKLAQYGWLEETGSGYSMHPFIAECISNNNIKDEEYIFLFERVKETWEEEYQAIWKGSVKIWNDFVEKTTPEKQMLTDIVLSIAGQLKGSISKEVMQLFIMATGLTLHAYGLKKGLPEQLEKMMKRCLETSDVMHVLSYVILGSRFLGNEEVMEQEMRRREYKQTISEELYVEFCRSHGQRLAYEGELERAKAWMQCALKHHPDGRQLVDIYLAFGYMTAFTGDLLGSLDWAEKSVDAAKKEKEVSSERLRDLMIDLSLVQTGLKRFNDAKKTLEQMELLTTEKDNLWERMSTLFSKGTLESSADNPEGGCKYLRKAEKLARYYYGEDDINYALYCEELAVVLVRLSEWEEAEQMHRKALHIVEQLPVQEFQISRIQNNMGKMYVDWNRLDEATLYLEKAYKMGQKIGGLNLAEPAYQLSRVYRKQNNREKELSYLQIAYPIFEQFYGEEHPRTQDVKKRMEEI